VRIPLVWLKPLTENGLFIKYSMEIKKITYEDVENEFTEIKPDLLDKFATYYGCFIREELVGVVSYVEHEHVIYLCHAFVKEEHRNKGIYKMLWNYRDARIKDTTKQVYAHCNVNSLKHFINNGFKIEKALFKVIREN
jgi:predicted GNAT family acetyltransferase